MSRKAVLCRPGERLSKGHRSEIQTVCRIKFDPARREAALAAWGL